LTKKVEVFIGIIHPLKPDDLESEEIKSINATAEVYQNMTVRNFLFIGFFAG